ncbi:hypothetical protein PZF67_006125 [Pseudomonas aeruginosa]|uniref:hypothetical protein n=1 Tax=Pseudomonas aeruginosa TaxID=287 RepID=UPI0025C9F243|nr:hypothetical protein [Pseudomonas aeruginosa]
MTLILLFTVMGSISSALAFRFTQRGHLNFGGEQVLMIVRLLIAGAVLMGFVCLGFKLAGYEEVGGGLNPWWTCLVFWAQAAFGTYTIFESHQPGSGSPS